MEKLNDLGLGAKAHRTEPNTSTAKPQRRLRIGLIVAAVLLVAVAAGAAYVWLSGGSGAPTSATTAPALARQSDDARALFQIVPDESEARFIIDEVLLGSPTTVVGATQQLAGEMLVDIADPSSAQLGDILVNVDTLATDNEFRNRALRGQILQSGRPEYEFAEFTGLRATGLPDHAAVGDTLAFQIEGMLRLRDVTHGVVFDATVTGASADRLEGQAQARIERADYGLTIPEAPGVANVSETVLLELDFVAEMTNPPVSN